MEKSADAANEHGVAAEHSLHLLRCQGAPQLAWRQLPGGARREWGAEEAVHDVAFGVAGGVDDPNRCGPQAHNVPILDLQRASWHLVTGAPNHRQRPPLALQHGCNQRGVAASVVVVVMCCQDVRQLAAGGLNCTHSSMRVCRVHQRRPASCPVHNQVRVVVLEYRDDSDGARAQLQRRRRHAVSLLVGL